MLPWTLVSSFLSESLLLSGPSCEEEGPEMLLLQLSQRPLLPAALLGGPDEQLDGYTGTPGAGKAGKGNKLDVGRNLEIFGTLMMGAL